MVVGPNGSGKSTFLNAVSGSLESQATGDIVFCGRSIGAESPYQRARRIALVHQDPVRGTAAHLSLEEHCRLTSVMTERLPVTWADVSAKLESLGTHLEPKQLAGELSGGQRQLFTVILAVLSQPKVLLLDEPTSALDARHQASVLAIIQNHVARGDNATVYVTHDLSEVLQTGNRLLVFEAGGRIHRLLDEPEKDGITIKALRDMLASAASATWARK